MESDERYRVLGHMLLNGLKSIWLTGKGKQEGRLAKTAFLTRKFYRTITVRLI